MCRMRETPAQSVPAGRKSQGIAAATTGGTEARDQGPVGGAVAERSHGASARPAMSDAMVKPTMVSMVKPARKPTRVAASRAKAKLIVPIVLAVTGGRRYWNREFIFTELDKIHARWPVKLLIHGGALGADLTASEWAVDRGIWMRGYPANWWKHEKVAGPIRNRWMLLDGKPGIVVAFKGGHGTLNMVMNTRRENIRLIDLRDEIPRTYPTGCRVG